MSRQKLLFFFFLLVFVGIQLPACPGFRKWTPPARTAAYPFQDRIETETKGKIEVSVAVPTREETMEIFYTDLYAKGMQPVWIEVTNPTHQYLGLLPSSIDPEYFSPNEAAYKTKDDYSPKGQWDREIYFQKLSLPTNIPPQSVASGFIITHLDKVAKHFIVDILTEKDFKRFNFLIRQPILREEYTQVDLEALYAPEEMKEVNLEELRAELESLPCCAPVKKGESNGDPVNLILIGNNRDALSALVRSGWKVRFLEKERVRQSEDPALSKRPHRFRLRAPLWYFDRTQDVGFYKSRRDLDEYTQFWLWLTPWRHRGKSIWIGTLTRDIGLRYQVGSPYLQITPKIDSDVDETRAYLLEDLISIGAVEKIGWIRGVGPSTPDQPKRDSFGDGWYSDGLRLVVFISGKPVDVDAIEVLHWDFPQDRAIAPARVKKRKRN